MFLVDQLILLAAVLLLFGAFSSKLSTRLGLPVLVIFLAIGMAAGEDGIGGIEFENFQVAHAIGTLALALILLDGGLQTRTAALRAVWKPAMLLATVGVAITAAITGLAAAVILDLPLMTGLLLGSIVASTDAAAVFSVLRSQGLNLRQRVAATLEVESGSNDPMAIFLTIGLLEVLTGRLELGFDLFWLFARQMGLGAVVGLLAGVLAVVAINAINLTARGLYPVLTASCGLAAYGIAATLGGSGFLAIYLAGIVIGNQRTAYESGTALFMDGLAWLGQITMFVVLGLLSTPSDLFEVSGRSVLLSLALIFVARPLAVMPLLAPFRFTLAEATLIAWVGLKGAVPIILAIFPLMWGLPDAPQIFNVVFFVVLLSATFQGWTLPAVARLLRVQEARPPAPAASLEIMSLREVNAEIMDVVVTPESGLAGRTVEQLQLPSPAILAMVLRGKLLVAPRGSTRLERGDHLFIITRSENRPAVERTLQQQHRH